jgi:hypothetical protein
LPVSEIEIPYPAQKSSFEKLQSYPPLIVGGKRILAGLPHLLHIAYMKMRSGTNTLAVCLPNEYFLRSLNSLLKHACPTQPCVINKLTSKRSSMRPLDYIKNMLISWISRISLQRLWPQETNGKFSHRLSLDRKLSGMTPIKRGDKVVSQASCA